MPKGGTSSCFRPLQAQPVHTYAVSPTPAERAGAGLGDLAAAGGAGLATSRNEVRGSSCAREVERALSGRRGRVCVCVCVCVCVLRITSPVLAHAITHAIAHAFAHEQLRTRTLHTHATDICVTLAHGRVICR